MNIFKIAQTHFWIDCLKSNWLSWIIFYVFLLHVWIGLEHESFLFSTPLYVNEILSFCGVLTLIQNWTVFSGRSDLLSKSVMFLAGYGLLYSLYSGLFLQEDWYGFLRTLPVWYSIFGFFLGCSLWNVYLRFKDRLSSMISWSLALLSLFSGVSRTTPVYILIVKSLRSYDVSILLLLYLISGDSTGKMVFLSYLIFILLRASFIRLLYPPAILIVILCGFLFLNWSYHEFNRFYSSGKIHDTWVEAGNYGIISEKLGVSDNNAIWRLMFWSYAWEHHISENPVFGIGFGTPLFGKAQETWFIWYTNENNKDLYFPYTLGVHNSFIFLLIRLGLIGFVPLLFINFWLYRVFIEHPLFLKNREINVLFIGFIFMTVNAMFNVILESPRYAGIYWAILGLLYQSIQHYYPKKVYKLYPSSTYVSII
ncbi:MAG: O-antigen ligase family protein [SAR324 cluster bacterium]|nr:O-antigen ligase family protein [SAR324 cluster bacterium]